MLDEKLLHQAVEAFEGYRPGERVFNCELLEISDKLLGDTHFNPEDSRDFAHFLIDYLNLRQNFVLNRSDNPTYLSDMVNMGVRTLAGAALMTVATLNMLLPQDGGVYSIYYGVLGGGISAAVSIIGLYKDKGFAPNNYYLAALGGMAAGNYLIGEGSPIDLVGRGIGVIAGIAAVKFHELWDDHRFNDGYKSEVEGLVQKYSGQKNQEKT